MISFARFKGSPPVQSFIHGDFSAKTRRQSFTACLTTKGIYQDMPTPQLSVNSKKFAWWVLTGMGAMILAFATFCGALFYPLKERVVVIETQVNGIGETLKGISNRLDKSEASINSSQEALRASIDENTLPLLLKKTTKGKPEELKTNLLRAQRYLDVAKEKRVPSNPNDIKGEGLNLLNEGKKHQDSVLSQQAWRTAIKAAEYLTVLRPVPQAVIEESKDKNKYFEGPDKHYTLSINIPEGSVYKDTIVVYKGESIDLSKVYFINVKFDIEQGAAGEEFLRAILNSAGLAVNFEFPRRKPTAESAEDVHES